MMNLFGRRTELEQPNPATTVRQLSNPIAEIKLVGEIVIATLTVTELADDQGANLLANLLDDLVQSGARHFVLDIQNVQFMNSACLGCLVEALNGMTRSGGKIALVNPANSVQSLFRLTRLDRVFLIHHDVPSALAAVEDQPEA